MKRTQTTTERLFTELNEKGGISQITLNHLRIPNFSMKESALILLKFGWYIPREFKLKKIAELTELGRSKNFNEIDEILTEFFNEKIDNIEENLVGTYSERSEIIKEAFNSHKMKLYYSSTILFLSQADGITESKMFIGRKNFEKNIDSRKNPDIVNILGEESPLNVDTRKDNNPNYFSDLNRHGVMHGLSNNYGSEKNSLKALSLLCFVSDFYNRYE
ncbi:hypothetical protein [uncultured Dokdonia sp.]|uniref:hypothetical protein n=1 Tax=Dokdonia sp. R78006 TaxID=3093866 RepID=UPI002620BBEC|nr:hypothetical protein [uncultured Dokdonia sp.]